MTANKTAQLIEKTILQSGEWLTFWDINERAQFSVKVDEPASKYQIGEIFAVDRSSEPPRLEFFKGHIDDKLLLIPCESAPDPEGIEIPLSATVRISGPARKS